MLIGLTGMSGAGKSTVAALLEKKGFRIIDCDALVHSLYEDARYARLVENAFGKEYIRDGVVDRKKLGSLVFSDAAALKKLNETVSPFMMCAVTERIEKAKTEDRSTVLDAPLLFEYGLEKYCDAVIGVTVDTETAVQRLSLRDRKSEEELRARLRSQHDVSFFKERCDYVLSNDKDGAALSLALDGVLEKIYIYR
jgi:dephospho-CoA kinase